MVWPTVRLSALGVALGMWLLSRAAAATPPAKCLLFLADRITWQDVAAGQMPNLAALAERGAAGSCSLATARPMTAVKAYATIGAGNRADGPSEFGFAPDRAGAVVANTADFHQANKRLPYSVQVGSLGEALRRAGLKVAVCYPDHYSPIHLLTAMDAEGRVPWTGTNVAQAWQHGDLVVFRAVGATGRSPLLGEGPHASRYPREVDAYLGEALRLVRDDDLLIFLSPLPANDDLLALGPIVVAGPGFPAGTALTSRTTLRRGIVASIDIAPTILAFFGVPFPPSYVSNAPMTAAAPGLSVSAMADFDTLSRRVDEARHIFLPLYAGWYLLAVVAALLLASMPRPPWLGAARWSRWVPLSVPAALPAAYLLAMGQTSQWSAKAILAAGVAGTAVLTAVPPLLRLSLPVAAGALSLLAVVVISADVVTGASLQMKAIPGYAVALGGRFYGIGNEGMAVAIAAAALLAALLVAARPSWPKAAICALLFAVVTAVVGSPRWGANSGGALTAAATFTLCFLLLFAPRFRWWHAVLVVGAMLAAIATVVLVDLHRPAQQMTHIGRAWLRITGEGGTALSELLRRKLYTSWEASTSTPWAIAPLLWVIGFVAALLRPWGRVARWLDHLPGLRPAGAAVAVGGLIGAIVNDSALAVPAMMLTFVVPLLAAAAVDEASGAGEPGSLSPSGRGQG